MRWQVHSEQSLYTDEWLDIRLADVGLPDGRHLSHRMIRTPAGAGAAVTDDRRRVLLLWRHRFITDSWGWELPLGRVEDGESAIEAAARETEEETGWRPGPLTPLLSVQPSNGISDAVHHVFHTTSATHLGDPVDAFESERIDWVPLADIPKLVGQGEVISATTIAALLYLHSR